MLLFQRFSKTPEFTKMGGIHELFVFALSLVWFARATPDSDWIAGRSTASRWERMTSFYFGISQPSPCLAQLSVGMGR